MTTPKSTLNDTSFVSTFLSHSSTDKDLVEAVATKLGKYGVLTWFDKNELLEMGPLDTTLKRAVQQQSTLSIFLSEASAQSSWCTDELKWAIEAQDGCEHLLPIYLGNPLQLVKKHDVLKRKFLHGDGNRVNQLGYAYQQNSTEPDADAIAEKIAATAYHRKIPKDWSEILIILDQRGNGPRRGFPQLDDNIVRLNIPTLTFRHSLELRQQRELIKGAEWKETVETMSKALSLALNTVRGETRKVRVLGQSQASLVWAVGRHFDRTTTAELYGYDRDGIAVTNKGQVRHTPIPGGNPQSAKQVLGQPVETDERYTQIALGIGSQRYASDAHKAAPNIPLFWIDSGMIENSEQAMTLVKDIVASVDRFREDYGARELVLFWGTANHVALLAAANLTSHVISKIKFMERDHAADEYVHLPMPGDAV